MRCVKLSTLLIFAFLVTTLFTQCDTEITPRVPTHLETIIVSNAVADSCIVDFDSLGKRINVRVSNPQKMLKGGPVWREISLVALQVMYSMEQDNFTSYDSVHVEFVEYTSDSVWSAESTFHTQDIRLVDFAYKIAEQFIAGNGTIAGEDLREFFDESISDQDLLMLDSIIESGGFFGDPTLTYGLNGFRVAYFSEQQQYFLTVNVSISTDTIFQESQLVVDLYSGLIVGIRDWAAEDEVDPGAPMVHPI